MAAYKKEDYSYMTHVRVGAFIRIARELGKDHELVELMGPLAWGRHNAEFGPNANTQDMIRAKSFLDGVFDTCIRWANINGDGAARRVLADNYPRGFASHPTGKLAPLPKGRPICVPAHAHFVKKQVWEIVEIVDGHVFAWRNDKDAPNMQYAYCLGCGHHRVHGKFPPPAEA
jgi:hypothetical protein